MKKLIYLFGLVLLFACTEKEEQLNGTGTMKMDVQFASRVIVESRAAVPESEELLKNCLVTIYNSKNQVEEFFTGSAAVEDIYLKAGDYKVVVEAGESVAASFDKIYYKGEKSFTIVANQSTPVNVECKIANALVTVNFHSSLRKSFDSYTADVFVAQDASLTFNMENSGSNTVGSFTLTNENQLSWVFYGNKSNGEVVTDANVFTANPATQYNLTFRLVTDPSEVTGNASGIVLEVEETPLETIYDKVEIHQRPVITGLEGFDIEQAYLLPENNTDAELKISVKSVTALSSILLSGEELDSMGYGTELSLMENNYTGISLQEENSSSIIITLSGGFLNQLLSRKDTYIFTITAFDSYVNEEGESAPKIREAALTIRVTDSTAPTYDVTTNTVNNVHVWAKKATISGTLNGTTSETPSFEYRKDGTDAWSSVIATFNGNNFSTTITGLEDAQTYQYRAVIGEVTGNIQEFTTEEAAQLPNSGFESWGTAKGKVPPLQKEKTFACPYNSTIGESMFWDTGNWGAQSADKTLTDKSTDFVRPGSTYSVRMESMKPEVLGIGRFAAGNIFTGVFKEVIYKALDGGAAGAGGKLDFGRPFTSRPMALKFWYKYTCGGNIVIDEKMDIPAAIKQEMVDYPVDKANIYIALTDKGAPFEIVNTKSGGNTIKLFDKTDESIIAYGSWEQSETTEALQEVILNLEYRHFDRKPTHIVVVCSSSKYGDYFCGAIGSTLYLDDLELIYE